MRNKISVENKNSDEIVLRINKEKVVNGFFISVLVIAALFFVILLGRGIVNSVRTVAPTSETGIDASLIAGYYDEYLDIFYYVPAGTWGMAQDDTIADTLKKVSEDSKGYDGYFDIMGDVLNEEVLSSMWLEETDMRQYISFSFKPDLTFDTDSDFILFATEGFKADLDDSIMETEGTEDYKYDLYDITQDESGGVLMKMKVVNTYRDEETGELEDIDMYLIRYSNTLGLNAIDITYGCTNEDDSIVPYLKYFMNSMIPNLSRQSNLASDDGTASTNPSTNITVDDIIDAMDSQNNVENSENGVVEENLEDNEVSENAERVPDGNLVETESENSITMDNED